MDIYTRVRSRHNLFFSRTQRYNKRCDIFQDVARMHYGMNKDGSKWILTLCCATDLEVSKFLVLVFELKRNKMINTY